jgi:hypothetical protein
MSRHPIALVAVLLATLPVLACRSSEDEAAGRRETKGTRELMAEVAKARYDPPADGLLTEEQVRMYLAVKSREAQIRENAAGDSEEGSDPGTAGDLATADLRAAQELGYNPKEYAWVEERVLEAQMADAGRLLRERLEPGRARYLAMLEAQRATATDAAEKAQIGQQIEDFKREAAESDPQASPAVERNLALLGKYRERLDRVQSPEDRLATGRFAAGEGAQGGGK